jgi:hypothetical protein
VITDRLTAKVIGLLFFVMPLIVTVSCFVYVKPEMRTQPGFVAVVLLPALPLFFFGMRIFRKANRLEDDETNT